MLGNTKIWENKNSKVKNQNRQPEVTGRLTRSFLIFTFEFLIDAYTPHQLTKGRCIDTQIRSQIFMRDDLQYMRASFQ